MKCHNGRRIAISLTTGVDEASGQKAAAAKSDSGMLKGWQKIATFLGQHVTVAQRWAKTGMPVRRQGRIVTAVPSELNQWLTAESGNEPVHLPEAGTDLSKELKRGLLYSRQKRKPEEAK
jgi:hypothetical protein